MMEIEDIRVQEDVDEYIAGVNYQTQVNQHVVFISNSPVAFQQEDGEESLRIVQPKKKVDLRPNSNEKLSALDKYERCA